MIIHEDLTKTRIVFHEVQKRLDSVRAVQKAIRDQRQSNLAAIGAAQKALKEQTAVFPPLSIDFAAIRRLRNDLPAVRSEATPAPAPKRVRRPATAGDPEVEASQKAYRERMLDELPDYWFG